MICRSCGGLYFRKNTQSICLMCYTNGERRERIYYTPKVWKKFSYKIQRELLTQYDIIFEGQLSARLERRAKIKRGLKLANNYLNKALKQLDNFSKATKKTRFGSSSGNMDLITGGLNKATGSNKDFSVLTGGGEPKAKRKKVKVYYEYKNVETKHSDPYSALSSSKDPVI